MFFRYFCALNISNRVGGDSPTRWCVPLQMHIKKDDLLRSSFLYCPLSRAFLQNFQETILLRMSLQLLPTFSGFSPKLKSEQWEGQNNRYCPLSRAFLQNFDKPYMLNGVNVIAHFLGLFSKTYDMGVGWARNELLPTFSGFSPKP